MNKKGLTILDAIIGIVVIFILIIVFWLILRGAITNAFR